MRIEDLPGEEEGQSPVWDITPDLNRADTDDDGDVSQTEFQRAMEDALKDMERES